MIFIGSLLIVTGVLFLLNNLGIISHISMDLFWPILVIALGVHLLLRRKW
ncbi:MAG: hypothetical protein HGB03_03070 [Candidatus Yonathbacteria bacterium]|nr:hypothetical protein [Candidatus Yonathbacteria bacterium]NTW47385.1 hypothetical protein [Candidatus Yonathbacteria bacterium]